MRQFISWLLAGVASAVLTVAAFLPASWMAPLIERQTAGLLILADAQGTLWRGSAIIGAAPGSGEPVTPLLPGRFSWRLSPMLLLGKVEAELVNVQVLSQPVEITGGWHQWQVGSADVQLSAESLAALGAPLNTIQPSGQMRLSWETLRMEIRDGKMEITGAMRLAMNDIASRLSPVKPLGAYDLALDWRGNQVFLTLKTARGPMLLSGSGLYAGGRLHFSGRAEAEAGHEERLANFLNLLGQRRREGDRNVIALELK